MLLSVFAETCLTWRLLCCGACLGPPLLVWDLLVEGKRDVDACCRFMTERQGVPGPAEQQQTNKQATAEVTQPANGKRHCCVPSESVSHIW